MTAPIGNLRALLIALAFSGSAFGSANDSFFNSSDLGSATSMSVAYDSRDATRQVGEPSHVSNTSTGSLWWRWTAPADGQLWLKLAVAGVDSTGIRAVYTGSTLAGLSKVAEINFGTVLPVPVTAGITYHVAVADSRAARLGIEFFGVPVNDAFESRIDLGGPAGFTIQAATVGATLQSGEPGGTSQGPTLWWSWQAPVDGIVTYDLAGSDSDYWNTATYTGTTPGTLVKRSGRNYGQAAASKTVLRVKAGETFAIQTSRMTSGEVGKVRVNWHLDPQSYQATAIDSLDLGSVSLATGSADNRNAITPADTTYAKLWWRWTAPANGVFRWSAERTDGNTSQPTARVFDTNLQELYKHSTWQAYSCRAGQSFLLSAETAASSAGRFDYQLTFEPSAINDALANALPLQMGDQSFDLTYSGIESGEPVISSFTWGRSLWWQWTPPADGALWLDIDRNSLALGVWGLDPLIPGIKSNYSSKQLMVTGVAGVVRRVGILESDSSATSPGKLSARFIPKATGNDAFAAAAELGPGWNVAGYGDPAAATREAGEPSPVSYGGSLWWKWTAPGNGSVRLRARVESGGTGGLWLYRGADLGSLVQVTGLPDPATAVTAGETLWVAITRNNSGVSTPIAFELLGAPNDAFAAATDLGSVTTWQPTFFLDATSEPGEPISQRSLWWKWTAPQAGNVIFSVPSGNALCSVYQGTSLANLALVADSSTTEGGRFIATPGAGYWVAVTDSFATYPVQVDWRLVPTPPGDPFSTPVELGQATSFTLDPAATSLVEPIEAGLYPTGYNQSLGWRWTAPANGMLAKKTLYPDAWLLFEETGGPGAGLASVASESVTAGHHYRIVNIDGPYRSTAPATWVFHAAPVNDSHLGAVDLGNATAVITQIDPYASTLDATETTLLQGAPASFHRGVWWQWTAPFDGILKCMGEVNDIWSVDYLSLVIQKGSGPPTWQTAATATSISSRYVECLATIKAGSTYKILLGIGTTSADLAKLTLSAWPAAFNNDWADAANLGSGTSADARGNNTGATRESFEPSYGSGSVWWKWTAPDVRNVFVSARIGGATTQLGIYQSSGSALVSVPGTSASSSSSLGASAAFRSQAGRTYWFSVSGADTVTIGEVELALRTAAIPTNDDFANRIVLSPGLPLVFSGNTAGATVEPGELTYDGNFGKDRCVSLWWSWTAPASGPANIEISGENSVYVLTGNSIGSLTTLKRAYLGNAGWTATAGVTYHFAVASFNHTGAPFQCKLSAFGISTNDAFANPGHLGGVTEGQWNLNNLLCTAETGEPTHGGQSAARSLWYDWTAPASGGVFLEAVLGGFQARVGIYTGTAVGGLQNVAGGSWKVAFKATAGQTYRIAVDGTEGLGKLTLKTFALPSNDLFANRTVLTGWPLSLKGSTLLADKETSEPGTSGSTAQRTLWWEWVAPSSTSYTIATAPGTYNTSWSVYSSVGAASSFSSLSLVASSGSFGTFNTTAGRYYYFKVYTTSGYGEPFEFRMDRSQFLAAPPPNNDFANRIILGNQAGVKATGDFLGATLESWETGTSTQGSLWWSWTAPSDGVFGISRTGAQAVTTTIYTGSNSASLVTIASGTGNREWFSAVAGINYQIRCLSSSNTGSNSTSRLMGFEIVAGVPPVNDAFAAAVSLPEPGTTSIEGYNAGAGAEGSESAHAGTAPRASVWYRWTATVSGLIQISTTSATMRTGVYQGASLDSLAPIAAGNTTLTFTAALGETYRIALDSNGDETFFVRLNQAVPIITNDAFASAAPLSGASVETPGSTVGATLEPGEPYHTGSSSQGGSAWWTWTAPATGAVEVAATATTPPHFAIYQGSAVDQLESVASGSGACRFQAFAGTIYRIAASGTSSSGSNFVLKIDQAGNAPFNDAFAGALPLAPQALVEGTVDGASRETGESWHDSSPIRQSVWYRWTAPANGRARVTLLNGSPGSLIIYRGTTLTNLSLIVSSVTDAGFPVSAGDEIRILVGLGSGGTSGAFELAAGMIDTGSNDSFANRMDLGASAQASWSGTIEDATIESGEIPYEYYSNGSRWWKWTAPADGGVALTVGSGRILPTAYVYTGSEMGSLSLLASSSSFNRVAFNARAGTTYQIALRGKPSATGIGDFLANLSLQLQPNDNQADANLLDGVLPVSGTALLAGATSQPGENASSNSVWWRWVSSINGEVTIDARASDFSPEIGVWTGPGLPSLQSVFSTYQISPIRSFTATAGTSYWISMSSGQSTVFGIVRFQIRQAPVPPNDLFANALPLAGETLSIDTLNDGATTEAGEPSPRSRPYTTFYTGSLWWKWVAPRSGLLRLNITGGWAFLYEGVSLQGLQEVAGPGGATTSTNSYWVEAGREYQICAGNSAGGQVGATFQLSPPGDSFGDALEIAGNWVKRSGSLVNCFWEAGEPFHAGVAPQSSLWFRWRAPSSGSFRVMAKSGTSNLRTAAYAGDAVATLSERGSGLGEFTFTATAGQEYRIVVNGSNTTGAFDLVIAEEIPAYSVWRDAYFDFMDPASSRNEDPDCDGLVNLIEASLGSDPLAFTGGPVFTVDSFQGKIRLNLRRRSGHDWRHSFDLSPSLGTWQSTDFMNREETLESHGDGSETLHVVLHDYLVLEHRVQFFRLKVESPPLGLD